MLYRYEDLLAAKLVKNRPTLARHQDLGIFPPYVDLGPNTVAILGEDIAELRERLKAGVTTPHPDWLARHEARKARMAERNARRGRKARTEVAA